MYVIKLKNHITIQDLIDWNKRGGYLRRVEESFYISTEVLEVYNDVVIRNNREDEDFNYG